jgi:cyclopropane-fatty-acyl-phospholipid synthase
MSHSSRLDSRPLTPHVPPGAQAMLRLLQHLPHGRLELQAPDGTPLCFGSAAPDAPHAAAKLHDWSVCGAILRSGDIGFAEGYIDGHWDTADLSALMRLLLANREAIDRLLYGHWWGRLAYRVRHLLRHRNSRATSRRNIHAHYDLGNEFYGLWLDGDMTYSAALFEGDPARSLEQAQQAKLRRAMSQCNLRPGNRMLELGCGWGSLTALAAGEIGAFVTGLTLSPRQLPWAQARLQSTGLAQRAEVRLQDYRDLDEPPFDAIVSLEMFEALGEAWWPRYFHVMARHLQPGGHACIQTITIDDALFERYKRSTDFIQQYVFPGGLLPSSQRFRAAAQAGGFDIVDEFGFGADYAHTLRLWRARFQTQLAQVVALGFDERFLRLWDFYLAYCEAAFDSGSTGVVQFTLRRR